MSKEYPLYPRLSEEAKKEAELLFEQFRERMNKVCDETLDKLYCDVSMYIESDHWTNYRNQIMEGFKNYNNKKIQAEFDFKDIRAKIFEQFKDEIIKDLNQDLVKQVEELQEQIAFMQRNQL